MSDPAAPRRSLLSRALGFLRVGGTQISAATQLPDPDPPKAKKGQQTVPSHLTTATPDKSSPLPRLDRQLANTDLVSFRFGAGTREVMRSLAAANPDLSAAVFAYLRTAITSYVAVAKNRDGTFNPDATNVLQQVLSRMDVLGDYKDGFNGISSIRSTAESLGRELLLYGALAGELVLDKAFLPREITPVSTTTVQFRSDGLELMPFQKIGSDEVDLDIPTFFYISLDQDLLEPYANSPFESAIQPILFAAEFMNDLRRIVKKAIHPRVFVKIDVDKFAKLMPAGAEFDDEKRTQWMNTFLSQVEQKMNGLQVEDAMVYFDSLDIGYLTAGNTNHDGEVQTLSDIIDAKVSTGVKALPSILGHGVGSQNIASVETMLFMKSAAGAIQAKLNEFFSRALTLALRLMGFDVVVEFKYDAIDLRPEAELEAFRTMRQERFLEQLSLGFITDDEASLLLTGKLPPPGFKPLSGTQFQVTKSGASQNGYTNQSAGGGDGGAGNRRPGGAAPKQSKGAPK